MSKTLGQVAFEAHMLSEDGFILPREWAAHDADEQKHWQAAAEAVVMQTTVDAVLLPQGRAVIEAAKAQEKEYARYLDNSRKSPSANLLAYRVACTATNIAVSALQEVE